jgi:hypothetical protein
MANTNHPNRSKGYAANALSDGDVARLAAHIGKLHQHRVGYPYEDVAAEKAWTAEHLPETKRDFDRVLDAVRAGGWMALEMDVASLLLNTHYSRTRTGRDEWVLETNKRPDLTSSWFTKEKPKKKGAARSCQICGRPASLRANMGWACSNHYDDLS